MPYPKQEGRFTLLRLSCYFQLMPRSEFRKIRQRLLRWYNRNRRDLPWRQTHDPYAQALMELGSRICLARHPGCPICPLAQFCAAKRSGCFAGKNPGKSLSLVKRRMQKVEWLLVVIRHKREILLRRRPSGGLLSGLWEVPGGERKKGETLRT